jgi:ribosome-binding ATPase YchF (GTP1/OBG family)
MKLAFSGRSGAGKTTLMRACAGRKQISGGRDEAGQATLAVPDCRVDKLSAMFRPRKTTYAQISLLDPPLPAPRPGDAGPLLPPELRAADGLILVVDNFSGFTPCQGQINSLEQDFLLNDLLLIERRLEKTAQDKQRGRAQDQEEIALLEEAKQLLDQEQPLRGHSRYLNNPKLRGFGLLSAKPLLVVVNNADEDPDPPSLTLPSGALPPALVVRGLLEAELAELRQEEEKQEFMADYGLARSALEQVLEAAYRGLGLISFFTVGSDEVRAWTVPRDSLAEAAAGVIHSDLQKGFIRAEIISYDDLIALGGEAAVKKAGRFKLAGRDYVVRDGDILHVRFNV